MSRVVTVRLSGGLGNQMFQYAYALASANGDPLRLDLSSFSGSCQRTFRLGVFGVEPTANVVNPMKLGSLIARIPGVWRLMRLFGGVLRIPGGTMLWDRMTGFDARMINRTGNIYCTGYWQDARYFESMGNSVREIFQPVESPSQETLELLNRSEAAIGVQVRRGDYTDASVSDVHPPQPIAYYEQAVAELSARHGVTEVIVCSDDQEWARANLNFPGCRVTHRSEPAAEWEDMVLLRGCAHVVISNSSFGWWTAWLGDRPGREIRCPDLWYGSAGAKFASPAPENWVRQALSTHQPGGGCNQS